MGAQAHSASSSPNSFYDRKIRAFNGSKKNYAKVLIKSMSSEDEVKIDRIIITE